MKVRKNSDRKTNKKNAKIEEKTRKRKKKKTWNRNERKTNRFL